MQCACRYVSIIIVRRRTLLPPIIGKLPPTPSPATARCNPILRCLSTVIGQFETWLCLLSSPKYISLLIVLVQQPFPTSVRVRHLSLAYCCLALCVVYIRNSSNVSLPALTVILLRAVVFLLLRMSPLDLTLNE